MSETRKLAAILAADVVGYSRLAGFDEDRTLARLRALRSDLIDPTISVHSGRVVKRTGDGALVEFRSVVDAVRCAIEVQNAMFERNAGVRPDQRIEFRVGIHVGDIIEESDGDLMGDAVNIAARLEGIAEPNGICLSGAAYEQVRDKLKDEFEDLGDKELKNIVRPVRAFRVVLNTAREPFVPDLPGGKLAPPGKPSIAVLPFQNMSGDPEQEYFSDGITEDIITDLSKISGLSVIARNSVFTYKGKPADVQEVSRRFNVATVLEGSVRKAGQRVRINAQLVDGRDGTHLWADRYDRDLTDIFALQDEITHTIVDQLKVKLLPEEKTAIAQVPTENVEAYTTYLRGRELVHTRTTSSLQLARRLFARATDLDPNYARAYAGIADCDSFLGGFHGVPVSPESLLEICAKALTLDPSLPEAHASHGFALSSIGRHEDAVAEFERALQLDPNSYEAHYFYARHSFVDGDLGKAVEHYERAAEIDPDDYRSPLLVLNALQSLGRHDDYAKHAMMGLERAEQALRLHPEISYPAQLGACALAALGQRERAKEWADRALAIDPDDLNAHYNVACAYSLLGDADRAIDLLESWSRVAGSQMIIWFKNDTDFDPIRSHPRYKDLLKLIEQRGALRNARN